MGSSKTKQSGFSIVEGILIVVVVTVLGFIGWTVYHSYASKPAPKTSKQSTNSQTHASSNTKSNPSSQQNAASTNLVTDYFAPASISFAHDKKWTWDTSGETYGYYEHPNEKSAKLNLPYQGPNDTLPSKYTIGFMTDSIPPPTQSGMDTLIKLGQATLGSQTSTSFMGILRMNQQAGPSI